MLTPDELRKRAVHLMDCGIDMPNTTILEIACALADLCEQVAELREQISSPIDVSGYPYPVGKAQQPRLLKASEITVPGWYACRIAGRSIWSSIETATSTGHRVWITSVSGTFDRRSVIHENKEYYGPIQLPE